jgi:hypothetical protein
MGQTIRSSGNTVPGAVALPDPVFLHFYDVSPVDESWVVEAVDQGLGKVS